MVWGATVVKVMFSYSHRDEAVRDELEVHLAALRRQRQIETWHDRRIEPGTDFAGVIDENLEDADVILLLISPYFLASDYCYEIEMTRALERHEAGEARVIPIILDPCDWKSSPFAKLAALPLDGKPISKFANCHEGFLQVVEGLKAVTVGRAKTSQERMGTTCSMIPSSPATAITPARSSNLRVRKEFTDHERDTFLQDTFDYIAKFFEESLQELAKRVSEIDVKFQQIDANTFSSVIYRNGSSESECRVSTGSDIMFGKSPSIRYSSNLSQRNSFEECLSVSDDGYGLGLSSMGFFGGEDSDAMLSQQGAAEALWARLIRYLQ